MKLRVIKLKAKGDYQHMKGRYPKSNRRNKIGENER